MIRLVERAGESDTGLDGYDLTIPRDLGSHQVLLLAKAKNGASDTRYATIGGCCRFVGSF
ncbi:hypothetical protein GF377_03970 [candidate division GN15 bacterium]|nr:hypothetical protein [candidate division GN15 bacterium]